MDKRTVGWVGTGVMGRAMATRLLQAGTRLKVTTRTREKAQSLIEAGATWVDAPGDLVSSCEVIITMVGFPTESTSNPPPVGR